MANARQSSNVSLVDVGSVGAPMAEFPQNLEAENPLLAGLYAPDDSPQALRPSRVNVRVLSPMNASESRARSRVFPIVDAATDADLPVEALEFGGVERRLYQIRTSTVAPRTHAQKLCYPYVLVTRDAHDRVSLSSFVFDEYRPEHPIDWKRRAWLMVPVIGTLLIVVIAVLQMRGPGLAHFIQALFREVSLTALWLITSASALQRYRTLAPSSPPADFASAEEFSSQVAAALLAQGWEEASEPV